MDAYSIGLNKSDKFMVRVLGDKHVVVSAPRWLRKTKKAPAPLFKVSRQNRTIDHVLSTLGEGVYALQIPYEEAVGTLNVSMTLELKGFLSEEHEVDFGPCWLNMAAWKQAARVTSSRLHNELEIVQTSLTIVYHLTRSELSNFVQRTKSKFADRRKADQEQMATFYKWGAHTRDLVLGDRHEILKNLSDRLGARRKQTLQDIQHITNAVSQNISNYTRAFTDTTTYRVRWFMGSLLNLEIKAQGPAGDRLKNAQKRALRAWWKIVGVPQSSRSPMLDHESVKENNGVKEGRIHECFG